MAGKNKGGREIRKPKQVKKPKGDDATAIGTLNATATKKR